MVQQFRVTDTALKHLKLILILDAEFVLQYVGSFVGVFVSHIGCGYDRDLFPKSLTASGELPAGSMVSFAASMIIRIISLGVTP
jgi:hypothetical protein